MSNWNVGWVAGARWGGVGEHEAVADLRPYLTTDRRRRGSPRPDPRTGRSTADLPEPDAVQRPFPRDVEEPSPPTIQASRTGLRKGWAGLPGPSGGLGPRPPASVRRASSFALVRRRV